MKTLFASVLFFLMLCSFGNANGQIQELTCPTSSEYDRCHVTSIQKGDNHHNSPCYECSNTKGQIMVEYNVPNNSTQAEVKATFSGFAKAYSPSEGENYLLTESTVLKLEFDVIANNTNKASYYKEIDVDSIMWGRSYIRQDSAYQLSPNDNASDFEKVFAPSKFSVDTTDSSISFKLNAYAQTCPVGDPHKAIDSLSIELDDSIFNWDPVSEPPITYESITGPNNLDPVETGEWIVNFSGGGGQISYDWEYKDSQNVWNPVYTPSANNDTLSFAYDENFYLRITVSDENNSSDTSPAFYVTINSDCSGGSGPGGPGCPSKVTSNQEKESVEFGLEPNYPNPFNPATIINYSLAEDSFVTLNVYNISGQMVATIVEGDRSRGTHQATFNASSLSSGVYYYRLVAGSFTKIGKMTLIK